MHSLWRMSTCVTAPHALHLSSMVSRLVSTISVSGLLHCPHCTKRLMKPSSSAERRCVSCAPFTMARPDASSNFVCAPSSVPKYLVVSAPLRVSGGRRRGARGSAKTPWQNRGASARAARAAGARTGRRPAERLGHLHHVHHVRLNPVAAPLDLRPQASRQPRLGFGPRRRAAPRTRLALQRRHLVAVELVARIDAADVDVRHRALLGLVGSDAPLGAKGGRLRRGCRARAHARTAGMHTALGKRVVGCMPRRQRHVTHAQDVLAPYCRQDASWARERVRRVCKPPAASPARVAAGYFGLAAAWYLQCRL